MAHYNLIAYGIYAVLTYLITVRVGWLFHKHGIHFIRNELQDDSIANSVNNLLLVCYYLTNLGYITCMIWYWEQVTSFQMLVESLSQKVSFIVLMLGVLHFANMSLLFFLRKKRSFHS